MSKRELLPVASRWRNGLSVQFIRPETVAMPYVRIAISSNARCNSFFAVCALPEMREFRSGPRGARTRGRRGAAIFQTLFGVSGVPLRSLPAALFYDPPIPQDSSINRSRRTSKSCGIIPERTAPSSIHFKSRSRSTCSTTGKTALYSEYTAC